jgi:NTE family protein
MMPATIEDGRDNEMALCLSGGGYRAMLFHLGSFWRLLDGGILQKLTRISSVSGGSITSALVGLRWEQLTSNPTESSAEFQRGVVGPIRCLARHTIDIQSALFGCFWPGGAGKVTSYYYRKCLFGEASLQSLPDNPLFVINATNLQSGVLWRFAKPYMADYRVGKVRHPAVPLATAVAASSAFPPFLSPLVLDVSACVFAPSSGKDLQRDPYTSKVFLSDGGVYDNLGLETAKGCGTILTSDGGGKMRPDPRPWLNWLMQSYRVLNVIDNQVGSLRTRYMLERYKSAALRGTYWGIRTDIADYGLPTALPCPRSKTSELANVPTRLKSLSEELQERLINWGYAVCDAALRKYYDASLPIGQFPYANTGV